MCAAAADRDSAAHDDPGADKAHADVGIVCALEIELGAFLERCERVRHYTGGDFVFRGGRYDQARIAVVESGMGFARARRATQALLDGHSPPWVLSAGFSGALLPEMHVGHVSLASAICDVHGNEIPVDLHVAEDRSRGLFVGRHVVTDHLVRTVAEKRELAARFDAVSVDLESLAVAQVCRERNVPFLSVRVISDDLSADLPSEVLTVVGATGSLRIGAALGALWKRPGSYKDMWRLRESAHTAAGRLATFLDGVVTQLHAARR